MLEEQLLKDNINDNTIKYKEAIKIEETNHNSIFQKIKNYTNTSIFCIMTGALNHIYCTCGYKVYQQYKHEYCPVCGSPINITTLLAFGQIPFKDCKVIFIEDEDKKPYKFKLLYKIVKGSHKINYKKKCISKIKIDMDMNLLIDFNGYTDKKDMIKYYNIDTEEELTEKEFKNIITLNMTKNDLGTYFCAYKTKDGQSFYKIDGKYNINTIKFNYINHAINELKRIAKWCAIPYNEILLKSNINPYLIAPELINEEGTTPSTILNLSKYSIKQLIKYQPLVNHFIETNLVNVLKLLEKRLGDRIVPYFNTFVELSNDYPTWLNYINVSKLIELVTNANISINKLYKYMYEDAPLNQFLYIPASILDLLCDSFNMTKDLNIDFDKAPSSLERYHNTLVKEIKILNDKDNDAAINRVSNKYKHLEYISEIDETTNTYKNKYSIIIPKTANDLIMEGKRMNHCVGSYIERMKKNISIILFVRLSDNINTSFVTMEYNPVTNSIVQIKARYNEKANKDTIDFIKSWAKQKNIFISNYH